MSARRRLASFPFLVLLALSAPAEASPDSKPEDGGGRRRVARLAWLEGDVAVARGDAAEGWRPGAVNDPLTTGDRLRVAAGGRAEVQLRGAVFHLAPGTELALPDLSWEDRSVTLFAGTVSVRVFDVRGAGSLEVATPGVSVALELPGDYRFDVSDSGGTAISIRRGRARAATAEGGVSLGWGERMRVTAPPRPEYDVVALGLGDAWDRRVDQRSARFRLVRSAAHVHADVLGIDDLDAWGDWEEISEREWAWFPRESRAGWMPYRSGRFVWRDPWGWTWLSDEPWGWAPYHHGRWAIVRSRWAWLPDEPKGTSPAWLPAVVTFVGAGPGGAGPLGPDGYVGWFPLAPGEPVQPHWDRAEGPIGDSPYRYLHRDHALYLPHFVFASGRFGESDLVHDAALLHDLRKAPVLRSALPVDPERAGTRTAPEASGAPASARLRPALPIRRTKTPAPAGRVTPSPAPTPARVGPLPASRSPRLTPRAPDAPPPAAPPWPEGTSSLEPRPRSGTAAPVEPRETTSSAPPWAPAPTPGPPAGAPRSAPRPTPQPGPRRM